MRVLGSDPEVLSVWEVDSIFSDQLIPVPGIPTVARVPFFPKVSQAPRPPTETEGPDLDKFSRRPLKIEIRRLKRKPISCPMMNMFHLWQHLKVLCSFDDCQILARPAGPREVEMSQFNVLFDFRP